MYHESQRSVVVGFVFREYMPFVYKFNTPRRRTYGKQYENSTYVWWNNLLSNFYLIEIDDHQSIITFTVVPRTCTV